MSVAERAAHRALAEGGIVVTTSSPDSAHLVGLRLARRGFPWVADFRDPWVRRMSFDPPTGAHRMIQESLESRVVRTADRVVVTSEATRVDFLARYPRLDPSHIVCIPNGYDEEDFPTESPTPDPEFSIVHSGQLNPERPISALLDHLDAFFSLRPAARAVCRVDLIGPRYREDEIEVRRRGLQGIVRFHDALPHREAVRRLLSARVLLLMEQESERGSLILPGKVFEYLRARRPILGLLPKGAAWDLIGELQAGRSALPSQPGVGGRSWRRCSIPSRRASWIFPGASRRRSAASSDGPWPAGSPRCSTTFSASTGAARRLPAPRPTVPRPNRVHPRSSLCASARSGYCPGAPDLAARGLASQAGSNRPSRLATCSWRPSSAFWRALELGS